MPTEALAAANDIPVADQCPEPPVIPIDFYDSGGEGRIFERLEPGKVGRALLNGKEVWVKQFTLNGKNEVLILRKGNPNQGGNWQTWEVARRDLEVPIQFNPVKPIFEGLEQQFAAAAARRARIGMVRAKQDEGAEEARGDALGIYVRDHIDGSPRSTVDLEPRGISIRINGGNLNVAIGNFFSVLEEQLNRLGKIQKITQPHHINHYVTAFSGQWDGVAFNAIRALAVTLDPIQTIRSRPNLRGTLEVKSEYSNVYGFNVFVFEYRF